MPEQPRLDAPGAFDYVMGLTLGGGGRLLLNRYLTQGAISFLPISRGWVLLPWYRI